MSKGRTADFFKQLQETMTCVEELRLEIKELRQENKRLKKSETLITQLYAENAALKLESKKYKAENTLLKSEIQKYAGDIDRMKNQLNKDSSNSSKPPSTDNKYKNRIFNGREKTGKKVGGQPGHTAHRMKLDPEPDKIIELKKDCCECGGRIKHSEKYTEKQVVDVQVITATTSFRGFDGICVNCGKKHKAAFPPGVVNEAQYGNNIKTLISMLSKQVVPHGRVPNQDKWRNTLCT